jgi:hypothetical protein
VVVSQQCHYFFRLGAFGKGGKTAQITERDNNLAAMAFENAFIVLRDDEVRELRGEEPP